MVPSQFGKRNSKLVRFDKVGCDVGCTEMTRKVLSIGSFTVHFSTSHAVVKSENFLYKKPLYVSYPYTLFLRPRKGVRV